MYTQEFEFLKGTLNNHDVVYHELDISPQDILDECGFIIAVSRDNPPNINQEDSCGFLYFRLAGTDEESGRLPGRGDVVYSKHILDIDYLTKDQTGSTEEFYVRTEDSSGAYVPLA